MSVLEGVTDDKLYSDLLDPVWAVAIENGQTQLVRGKLGCFAQVFGSNRLEGLKYLDIPNSSSRIDMDALLLNLDDGIATGSPLIPGIPGILARGISCDLESIHLSGSTKNLERRPINDPSLLFQKLSERWRVEEVDTGSEDPAVTISNNQEKLREYSAKRFQPTTVSNKKNITDIHSIEPESVFLSDDYTKESLQLLDEIDAILSIPNSTSSPPLTTHKYFRSPPNLPNDKLSNIHELRQFEEPLSLFMELIASEIDIRNALGSTDSEADKSGILDTTIKPPITVPANNDSAVVDKARSSQFAAGSPTEYGNRNKQTIDSILKEDDETKFLLEALEKQFVQSTASDNSLGAGGFLTEEEEMEMGALAASTPTPETQARPEERVNKLIGTSGAVSDSAGLAVGVGNGRGKDEFGIDADFLDEILSQACSAATSTTALRPKDKGVVGGGGKGSGGATVGVGGSKVFKWAKQTVLDLAEFEALRPRLALQYPFELDFFQKQAIMRLERRECVFVAAHTSAGKTVVAEYAIAIARKHMTRTIYTSPIKALSNQKYRDFADKFGDVGLITGDISVNPDASCLIMTTEILRSMLYRGADTIKDIEWVIFDEVHYVNDEERGVVWEEVIIMLPDRINLIFLSATTPNTMEFSDWIGRTKNRKVFVISTNKRPVPLQHYLLYDDEVYSLLGPDNVFQSGALSQAARRQKDKLKPKPISAENAQMAAQRKGEKAAMAAQASGGKTLVKGGHDKAPVKSAGGHVQRLGDIAGSKPQWLSILRILCEGGREEAGGLGSIDFGLGFSGRILSKKAKQEKERMGFEKYEKLPAEFRAKVSKKEYESMHFRGDEEEEGEQPVGLLPVVVFSFSKKKCDEIADYLKGQDLLKATEKSEVQATMIKVMKRLNPLDARLSQVTRMTEMLSRGVGVHHGGLLPLLKEAVEVLFSKSLVKVLFATETFAMGVNMPARAVLFNGYRKHDGKGFRELLPGEYTQMAGRAGRRGKDKFGTVIIAAWNELPTEPSLQKLLTGTATVLSSRFRLTYNMILNLLRVNDMSVEDMIKRSFSEFHTQRALTGHDVVSKIQRYERAIELLQDRLTRQSCDCGDLPDMEDYFQNMEACRALQSKVFEDVDRNGRKGEVGVLVGPGRIVYIHRSFVLPCPCVALVLTEPEARSLETSATSIGDMSSRVGLSGVAEARLALSQTNSKSAGSAIGNAGIPSKESLVGGAVVWALVLLPPGFNIPSTTNTTIAKSSSGTDGLLVRSKESEAADSVPWREAFGEHSSSYWLAPISLNEIAVVTGTKKKLNSTELNAHKGSVENIRKWLKILIDFRTSDETTGVSSDLVWDPKDLHLQSFQIRQYQNDILSIATTAFSSKCHSCPRMSQQYNDAHNIAFLRRKVSALKYSLSNENLSLFPDFQQRLSVLSYLGYVSSDRETVTLKGRVACEMNTCDELLATEMLFANILEPLNPPEAAAILSAFVFQEKNKEEPQLTTRMEVAKSQLLTLTSFLEREQEKFGVNMGDTESNSRSGLNFGLAAAVYEWARGTAFQEITQMTMTQEGSIVRCITRLDELCKDMRNAARVIGNPSLYRKMEAASQCIKRDIVFAASLYVS